MSAMNVAGPAGSGRGPEFLRLEKYRRDEIICSSFPPPGGMPQGQNFVFYENLFKDLRLDNVVVITLDSENSYNELGPQFSKYASGG